MEKSRLSTAKAHDAKPEIIHKRLGTVVPFPAERLIWVRWRWREALLRWPGWLLWPGRVELEAGFANPPASARLRAYWWWLNGNVTKAAITRDLEEMKAKGLRRRAHLRRRRRGSRTATTRCRTARRSSRPSGANSTSTRCARRTGSGLEMSLNIQSGWNLGGPMVKAEDAAKKLTWSEARDRARRSSISRCRRRSPATGSTATCSWWRIGSRPSGRDAIRSGRHGQFRAAGAHAGTGVRRQAGHLLGVGGHEARRGADAEQPGVGAARASPKPVRGLGAERHRQVRLRPARLRAAGLRRRQDVPRREAPSRVGGRRSRRSLDGR